MRRHEKVVISVLLSLICLSAHGETVSSLDQVPGKISNPAGQDYYAREMNGAPLADHFGAGFFAEHGLDPEAVLKTVFPQAKPLAYWGLIGMKAWPGQDNLYVFTACSSEEPVDMSRLEGSLRNNCTYDIDPKQHMIVALLRYDGKAKPILAAKPYVEAVHEDHLHSDAFVLADDQGENKWGDLDRLDFAPYRLNADTLAFGLRINTHTGYAGGGAVNEAVTLFAVIDGALRPVLSVPTYSFTDYAGSWHEDGTRDHDVNEETYVLSFLTHQTNGFYDIRRVRKGSNGKERQTYRWDERAQHYR